MGRVFRQMRSAKAGISKGGNQLVRPCSLIRVFAVANRIIEHFRMYQCRADARVRLAHAWDEHESVNFARIHLFAWRSPYNAYHNKQCTHYCKNKLDSTMPFNENLI